MALKNYLIYLAKQHKDGAVFLRDTTGKVSTIQHLLSSLSVDDLTADIDLCSDDELSWIMKEGRSVLGKDTSKKWFSIHGNKNRTGWAVTSCSMPESKSHFFIFDEDESEFISLCNRARSENNHFIFFTELSPPDEECCQLCSKKLSSGGTRLSAKHKSSNRVTVQHSPPKKAQGCLIFSMIALAAGLFYSCSVFNGTSSPPSAIQTSAVVYEPRDAAPNTGAIEPSENKSRVIHEASGRGWKVKVEYE